MSKFDAGNKQALTLWEKRNAITIRMAEVEIIITPPKVEWLACM